MGGGMAGEAMPKIMDADAGKTRLVTQSAPQVADVSYRALCCWVPEHIALLLAARQRAKDGCSRFSQPDCARAGLAVGQQQAPPSHFAPLQACNL
jgi:hypothetical protein